MNKEGSKKKGKGVFNLVDKVGPVSLSNESIAFDSSTGPSDTPLNLGPFENVFELTNDGIIGGNYVAEQGAELMTEIELSYVPDSSGQHYPLAGSEMNYGNMGQAYGAMSQTQNYTTYLNNMLGFNYGAFLSGLRSGRFFKDLIARLHISMEDLFTQAHNFIRADEVTRKINCETKNEEPLLEDTFKIIEELLENINKDMLLALP
ncbi:hypothetical protein Tco_0201688 [Tanacetum coccineum]